MESIITNENRCYICGSEGVLQTHHCVRGAWRKRADRDGLTVPLCIRCHTLIHSSNDKGIQLGHWLRKVAQEKWEERYPDRDFLKEYGRNFK